MQKAPAATLKVLATALKELYNADNEIKIIGTRHGEKLYETLVTREEMVKAQDMGNYYRIPCDDRTSITISTLLRATRISLALRIIIRIIPDN